MLGKILNQRYKVVEKIGEGGMSRIYMARDLRLKRKVALKILKEEFASDQEILTRFLREAQSAAKLAHPNIINVYDIEEDEGIHYIVMEFQDTDNLKQRIQKEGSLDFKTVLKIFEQISAAVKYAHENGIIHRDLKPQNVLLTDKDFLKVTDFGIARAVTSSSLTQTGSMMGSVRYFSPEQAQGKQVDKTTDIYALAILIYECLTGKVPFEGENPITIALKQVQEEPDPPSSIKSGIPPEVDRVILKALNKDPARRYQEVDEFYNAFKDALLLKKFRVGEEEEAAESDLNLEDSTLVMKEGPLSGRIEDQDMEEDEEEEDEGEGIFAGGNSVYVMILIVFLIIITLVFFKRGFVNPFLKGDVVPDLEGYKLQKARQIADSKGWQIQIKEERFDSRIPEGIIISQEPGVGSKLARGGTIEVVLSKGRPMLEVPDLVGLTLQQAREELTRISLKAAVQKNIYSDKYEKGRVISHEPAAQEMVSPGRKVLLVVSRGPEKTEVPDIIGLTRDEALTVVQSKGLSIQIEDRKHSNKYLENCIISQAPPPGKMVDRGGVVRVVISMGTESIKAPSLIGKTVHEARDFIEPMGIKLKLTDGTSNPEMSIVGQDPPPGKPINPGQTIKIWTIELVVVPNLLGRTLEDAQNVIDQNDLTVGDINYVEKPGIMEGVVLEQSPRSGLEVEAGRSIDLMISKKPTPTPEHSPEPAVEPSPSPEENENTTHEENLNSSDAFNCRNLI